MPRRVKPAASPGRVALVAVAESAGLAGLALAGAVTAPPARTPLDVAAIALLVVPAALAPLRRRWPVPLLPVAAAALVIYMIRGYPGVSATLPLLPVLFSAVRSGRPKSAALTVLAILVGGIRGSHLFHGGDPVPPDLAQRWFLIAGWLVAACIAGEASRQRDRNVADARRRAEEAERSREETALRRAGEERLRIARELHDSLTHCISVINVQAGVAVHLARKREEPVPEALAAIQEASKEAMRELRATLEVLRTDEPSGAGLDRLADLLGKTGLPVTLTTNGPERPLPAHVGRAAFRIVQESLTNVTRHAGTAKVNITLTYGDSTLVLQIDDDGDGVPSTPPEPGNGLVGMRERVTALGGAFHAGPRPDSGFTVRAALPLAPAGTPA